MNKTTMQTIADKLNISKASVSLALNGKPGVSDETHKEVLKIAQQMNYGNTNSSEKLPGSILVLIPAYIRNDRYFYNDIYWAIETRAKQRGYTAIITVIEDSMQEEKQMPSIYFDMKFLGAIIVGVLKRKYAEFVSQKIPNILSVDHTYDDLRMNSIVTANIEGAYQITRYVIEMGHRQIGFAGSVSTTASIFERWCGYVKAMNEAGLSPFESCNILNSSPLSVLLSDPAEMLSHLKGIETLPTAYICGGDRIALSLIEALKLMGKRVPDDVSVAGFDNIEAIQMVTPALTTMNVYRERLAFTAVDKLIRVANRKLECTKTSIYPDLVIRDSVKRI